MSDAPVDGQDPETEQLPPSAEEGSAAEQAEATVPYETPAEPEPAAPAKAKFDVFSARKTEPLPFSEAPDLEAEAEEEERAASPDAATTALPTARPDLDGDEPDEDDGDGDGFEDDEDPDEALTELVEVPDEPEDPDETDETDETDDEPGDEPDDAAETEVEPAAETEADPEPEAEEDYGSIEPAPPAAEVEETTLIPKVTPEARPTESTTVMPSASIPTPGMAHRPYSSAPPGYGRSTWGDPKPVAPRGPAVTPAGGLPDAQPTQVQPRVGAEDAQATQVQPAALAPPQGGAGRGYRPPQFRAGDAQRSELPPPQNFKLDRRELDAAADAEGGRKFGRRAMLIGGGAAVLAAAGLTVSGVVKLPGTTPQVPTVGYSPAANSGASSATQTGTAFLQAWQNGELETAANITDSPNEALAAFRWYKENLGVVGLVINPNAANGVGWMTFSINTQGGTPMGQWNYQSGFAAYSKQINGYTRWFVQWSPQILYTSLKAGYQLKIVKTPASVKGLVDRNNQPIDAATYPSLGGLIDVLVSHAKVVGATDGQQIVMVDTKGKQLATVATLTNPINNGTVKTTLDVKVQAAAEQAVKFKGNSSIVAIEPSTGGILAIANNTGQYYQDNALLARVAPGSTFKIITSTALLTSGMVTLDANAPCPAAITIEGTTLKNSEGEAGDGYTYEQDFAASCNNAFSSFWDHDGMTKNLLADTAAKYYGLNQQWDIGVGESAQYMTVPTGLSEAGLAESLVGQDNVVACPLAMCSVAATVANGGFMQPIVIPKYKQVTATPLPSSLQSDLKTLMASVITEGTADQLAFPHNGHYFAKTGTAEYMGSNGQVLNNSWFVVFNDAQDIAVCALAIDGGYGASTAGPECLTVFQKLGYA